NTCTFSKKKKKLKLSQVAVNKEKVAFNVQILTSRPGQLTTHNISTAAEIASSLLSLQDLPKDINQAAVTTVSQLLNAEGNQFSKSTRNSTNRVKVNNQTKDHQLPTDVQITINFKEDLTECSEDVGIVLYNNDLFFRSSNYQPSLDTQTKVISGNVMRNNVVKHVNFSVSKKSGINKWSSNGCSKQDGQGNSDVLTCSCSHTANFAVLMSFGQNFEYSLALGTISITGCALSIVGLIVTALFHILTRKSRQTGPTLLLVSICVSMSVFYFLFIFGIHNPVQQASSAPSNTNIIPETDFYQDPDRGPCTTFTALLQYFLLVTFMWNTLYAVHIYLLIRNISGPPQGFAVFCVTAGWGLPALIVGTSLGITYRTSTPLNYRQEEFCWLAGFDPHKRLDLRKPLFWGFLLPLAIMLLVNVTILIYFSLRTCNPNPELSSSQVRPLQKKILSSFSLAVILGVSWIIGYFMLLTTDPVLNNILTFVFCLCNTTQGIQIFILFTVRTSLFKQNFVVFCKFISIPNVAIHRQRYSLWPARGNDSLERYTANNFELIE
ncbi:hypothetical protein P4O66_022059, partial [Electrophorus voltai]